MRISIALKTVLFLLPAFLIVSIGTIFYTQRAMVMQQLYQSNESLAAMSRVAGWRADGIPVWFTMDAGPNLKLLFDATAEPALRSAIPGLRTLVPFPADTGIPRV